MKRILSIALAALLVITMIPMTVFADTSKATDIVDVTGKTEITLGGVTYKVVTSAAEITDAAGNYYLANDITLTQPLFYNLAKPNTEAKPNDDTNLVDGVTTTFAGKFNGGGHTVTLDGAKSIFSCWFGGPDAVFANFTVENKDNATLTVGGWGSPLGYYASKGGCFYNITNNVTVTSSTKNIGGIVGGFSAVSAPVIVENCVNNASVTGGNFTAGIVGWVNSNINLTVTNCTNNASVTGGNRAAGIVGGNAAGATLNITDCVNNASVTSTTIGAGGIFGGVDTITGATIDISNCVNYGEVSVTGNFGAGGIFGYINASKSITANVTKCANFGEIYSKNGYAGGIYGGNHGEGSGTSLTIEKCLNAGSVVSATSNYGNGGILGGTCSAAGFTYTVKSCANVANVTAATKFAAGIFGAHNTNNNTINISDCYNSGIATADNTAEIANIWGTVTLTAQNNYASGTRSRVVGKAGSAGTCSIQAVVDKANALLETLDIDGEFYKADDATVKYSNTALNYVDQSSGNTLATAKDATTTDTKSYNGFVQYNNAGQMRVVMVISAAELAKAEYDSFKLVIKAGEQTAEIEDSQLSIFTSVDAAGETYTAADGYYIFGAIINGAPVANAVTVQIVAGTDLAADVLYTGNLK